MAKELTRTAQILEGDFAVPAKAMRTMSETRYPSWDFDDLVVAPDRAEMTFDLKLITPMIGGGARQGRPDEFWPVRSSAIRGHLRFWWRALYAGRFGSSQELKREEGRIWGWGSGDLRSCSPVSIRVIATDPSPPTIEPVVGLPSYVTGVYANELSNWRMIKRLSFSLIISNPPELCSAVRRTVFCFLAFGGLGSRSRRGCGSIGTNLIRSVYSLHAELTGDSMTSNNGLGTSLIGSELLVRPGTEMDSRTAWSASVQAYQEWRRTLTRSQKPDPKVRIASSVVTKPFPIETTNGTKYLPGILLLNQPERSLPIDDFSKVLKSSGWKKVDLGL